MGNAPSVQEKEHLQEMTACEYILSMDYPSMKKMQMRDYCDKITTISSKLIADSLNEEDIQQWHQRRYPNVSATKKKQCTDLARFYTKLGHLFSAIIMAINPQYIYVDKKTGEYNKLSIREKHLLPKDASVHIVTSGLCQKRIDILLDKDFLSPKEDPSLMEETGIPELMDLYYDADYNKETGAFQGMKPDTSDEYQEDVELFYKAFTGEKEVPEGITSFSQIKLKDYKKGNTVSSNHHRVRSYRSSLLLSYAENIQTMMKEMHHKHDFLLDILNQMFIIEEKQGVIIMVHPRMTEQILNKIIEESRHIIIALYLHCEKDYERGLKIYEAIVESLILDTSQKQIKTLEEELESLYK